MYGMEDVRAFCIDLVQVSFFDLFKEIIEELFEDQWIDVLSQLVQQEPVSQTHSSADAFHLVHFAKSGSGFQHHFSQPAHEQCHDSIDDLYT